MKFIKLFIIGLLLMSIPHSATTSSGNGYIAKNLAKAQFTTQVKKRAPVDNIKSLSTEFKKVYFYSDIRDCKKCEIEHQWWYKGNKVSTVEGKAKYKRYRWWTSKTLTKDMLGDWTVKVVVDDDVVYSKTFTYYAPTVIQHQQAPMQQRLQLKTLDECEMQLRYFSGKVEDSPDDVYFKFMLKKWGKRCLGE